MVVDPAAIATATPMRAVSKARRDGPRIAAGDAMTKYPLRLLGCGEAPGTPPGEERSGSEALHKGPSGKG